MISSRGSLFNILCAKLCSLLFNVFQWKKRGRTMRSLTGEKGVKLASSGNIGVNEARKNRVVDRG